MITARLGFFISHTSENSKGLSKQLFTYVLFSLVRHFEPVVHVHGTYIILIRYGPDVSHPDIKSDGHSLCMMQSG